MSSNNVENWCTGGFIALVIIVLGVCIWVNRPPTCGVVIDKKFVAAHDVLEPQTYINIEGNMYPIYGYTHHPDKWYLYLRNGEREGWLEVRPREYDTFNFGDLYGVEQ